MLWPKKNPYKEFDNEKNSCGSKIPHPQNFSNDPSLTVTPSISKESFFLTHTELQDQDKFWKKTTWGPFSPSLHRGNKWVVFLCT